MTIATLAHLRPGNEYPGGSINSRRTYTKDEIATRATSLVQFGQLQSLLVCPAPGKTEPPYYVAAGGLRLAAFAALVKDKKLPPDHPIEITVRPDLDSAMALAASIEENQETLPPHPADVFEQFAELQKRGKTADDLAALYGLKLKDVRGILALGAMHPEIRAAWRQGEIKREIAQEYTIEPDQKRQLDVYRQLTKAHKQHWHGEARSALAGDSRNATGLLTFVGRAAFEAAGGRVLEDLFSDRHGVSDDALLKRLVDDKIAKMKVDLVEQDGWGWASLDGELPTGWRHQFDHIEVKPKYEPAETKRLKEIEKAIDKMERAAEKDGVYLDESDPEWVKLHDEQETIVLQGHARAFTPEQKKRSGVVISLDHDGMVQMQTGIVQTAARKDRAAQSVANAKATKAAKPSGLVSNALAQRLSEQLTVAIGDALAKEPNVAIPALIAGYAAPTSEPVKVSLQSISLSGDGQHFKQRHMSAKGFVEAFDVMLKQSGKRNGALAAICADALSFKVFNNTKKPLDDKAAIAIVSALNGKAVNAALRATFDAKDYFAGISGAMRVAAIREALGQGRAEQAAKLKKDAQVKIAVADVPKTGWLPPELRTSHYDGPATRAAKPKSKAASKKKTR